MIYFDNAATTKPYDNVLEAFCETSKNNFGNAGALHGLGIRSEDRIKKAKAELETILGIHPGELFFTSGGTESDNLAILGVAESYKRRGKHILTTKMEHPAVGSVLSILEKQGFEIEYLPVSEKGEISLQELQTAVRKDTILVSLMHVCNETGTTLDLEKVGSIIKKANPDTIFHSDGVQGFCKQKTNLKWVDLYSMSAHKIHGLKGIGALYIKRGVRLKPVLFGGGQQNGLRPGTENTAGIVAFAEAAKTCYDRWEEKAMYVAGLKKQFWSGLAKMDDVFVNGDFEKDSPYILNVSILRVKSEVLLRSLNEAGICISAGSACKVRTNQLGIVNYLGLPAKRVDSSVRFSFSFENTAEEIDICLKELAERVPVLRRYT